MTKFFKGLKRFVREEDAPTMAEYGLLLVFIALVVVVGANVLGSSIRDLFQNSGTAIKGVGPPVLPAPGSG
jgi:pilus assembly protein Flp/PilA